MIPKNMESFLKERLPKNILKNRLFEENGLCYLEFTKADENLLSSIGIVSDKLGPQLVACIWDNNSELEVGGYLVVDNLSMGKPSMGGIRMLPDLVPSDIYNLARGMTLKNAAANLPYGGGKSGIIAERDIPSDQHTEIVRHFARLINRYKNVYVPGPDVGTNDMDMKTIAIENGIDSAVSKTADMGGNRIDELGAAAGGVVIALQTLLKIMPRLTVLSQFSTLEVPEPEEVSLIIQGFGAVGAHAARILSERLPKAKVIGISDLEGYLYDEDGLPVKELFDIWVKEKIVSLNYFKSKIISKGHKHPIKYSSNPNNLLRENAFCLVPAAPIFNYLGVSNIDNPSMTVDRIGNWSLIVEGANTYSPDPNRKAARTVMEQVVYRGKGIMIANDYLVNSGGVIFAAQEHIIKTPDNLQIPNNLLGHPDKVEIWLKDHAKEFAKLSMERLEAGKEYRENVIQHNMNELVEILTSNQDMLPSAAAEQISLQRLSRKESLRTAKDIMISIPVIDVQSSMQQVAELMINENSGIVAVLSNQKLVGVLTDWDITKAIAEGISATNLENIMTKDVITASPDLSLLEIVRELEQYKISAMPVVKDEIVLGKISSDIITQHFILNLLQEQTRK
jgi:glutamate dehydrogenase/leucine dehydrogenase/CBS domain-containing protein